MPTSCVPQKIVERIIERPVEITKEVMVESIVEKIVEKIIYVDTFVEKMVCEYTLLTHNSIDRECVRKCACVGEECACVRRPVF